MHIRSVRVSGGEGVDLVSEAGSVRIEAFKDIQINSKQGKVGFLNNNNFKKNVNRFLDRAKVFFWAEPWTLVLDRLVSLFSLSPTLLECTT